MEKENPKKETSDEYSEDYTGQTDKEYENDAFELDGKKSEAK